VIYQDVTEHRNGRVEREEVSLALERILASRPFRSSNQCSTLLRYIVEHTLAGEENLLRERVIGAELFGRPADYETSEDPVVRLRVSEVRKRLAQYYLVDRDQSSVQIDIPSGGYRATFHWNAEAPQEVVAAELPSPAVEGITEQNPALPGGLAVVTEVIVPENTEGLGVGRPHHRTIGRTAILAAVVLVVVVAAAFALIRANSPANAFRAFWAPWMTSSQPVILSIGSNAVYRFQYEYLARYKEQHGLTNAGQEFYVPLEKGKTLSTDDLFAAYNSFVALGDVAAVSRIVATLTQAKKSFQERFPNDVSFAELRENPSVLIGGFNNPMTLALTKQLQFVMRGGDEIIDTQNPKRKWQLDNEPPDTADYAIITRLVQRGGDAPFIGVAGLGQYGTLAAAELICSPASIHLITDRLPKDWSDKNLQVVVRITIVNFKPSASEVVAYKSW
jgi:hypothetical protein